MRIWIDLAAPAHVFLFAPIIAELRARGFSLLLTARDFGETLALCACADLTPTVIGRHGGRRLAKKAARFGSRVAALCLFVRRQSIDLCVSHNAYATVVAAKAMGLRCVTMMDYEYQPANHLSFRLADRVILPADFERTARRHYGARAREVREYTGLKEEIYLAGFEPEPQWRDRLVPRFAALDVDFVPHRDLLVTLRSPPDTALYHRFDNALFATLLAYLSKKKHARIVVLPRHGGQLRVIAEQAGRRALIPDAPLDGRQLIAHSDLVISAGGTMAREAAVLGVPAATFFAGRPAGVDRRLIAEGRLLEIRKESDIFALPLARHVGGPRSVSSRVREQVMAYLLGFAGREGGEDVLGSFKPKQKEGVEEIEALAERICNNIWRMNYPDSIRRGSVLAGYQLNGVHLQP